ncbi:MAG TPA: universal stress protein [Persephonella sp.]|uniref:Universal stress protein family protein n=1 Tax=Persephonella marina (strain DSM 14350 / EX-H1) TaxID=123214 RepID=C0QUC9_PERMH|nr:MULTISPECIES: universal stress protein [Persephonella]ACO03926.1 universal stress protein family protein [Persephonella marina EX-H1]HCB70087.1 universal stress protein [Persephonella sp.]
MPFKKILVGIDFSEISDSIFDSALFLGKLYNADIHLIHVIEPISPLFQEEGFEPLIQTEEFQVVFEVESILKEEAKEKLERYILKGKAEGLNITSSVEIGNIAETILEISDEKEFDLIAIGSHKKGLLERVLLGSVAEKIVNKSKISTLVVKGASLTEINKILCGYDFLPNSIEALEVVKEIAKITKSEVYIVHADSDEWFAHLRHIYEKVFEKKLRLLEKIKEEISSELSVPVDIKIEKGKPEDVLLKSVEQIKPDLVVVGKRKGKDIKRFFLGTTAMRMVENSPVPVLIVRRR